MTEISYNNFKDSMQAYDKIVAHYEAGGSIPKLAKEIGVARGTLTAICFTLAYESHTTT